MTQALLNKSVTTVRHDHTLEVLPGEILELQPKPDRVEVVSAPSGPVKADPKAKPPTDLRISVAERGRYHFRFYDREGRHDLHVVCVDPALLPFVQAQIRSLGHGGQDPNKPRSVIRAMAQEPWFDGSIDAVTAHPNRAPMYYGA